MRWALVVVVLAAAVAGALWKAHDMGHAAGVAESAAVLAQWKAAVEASAHRRREAQQARYRELQREFDELRSRPAQIRAVVQTVEVRADDRCDSLPRSYRELWDAGYESGLRVGTATATAGLDDAGGSRVADLAR